MVGKDDMKHPASELQLYRDKANRLITATMIDIYQKIDKNQLPQTVSGNAPSSVQMDQISEEDTQRLRNLMVSLLAKYMRPEQNKAPQVAPKESSSQSHRKSVVDSQGRQVEHSFKTYASNIPHTANKSSVIASSNQHEATNSRVGHQHQQQGPLRPPEADMSSAHNSPPLKPETITLIDNDKQTKAAKRPAPVIRTGLKGNCATFASHIYSNSVVEIIDIRSHNSRAVVQAKINDKFYDRTTRKPFRLEFDTLKKFTGFERAVRHYARRLPDNILNKKLDSRSMGEFLKSCGVEHRSLNHRFNK